MTLRVKVEGLADLDAALADLSKAAARGALRRAGIAAMAPMAEIARNLAPVDDGELRDSIIVSAKAKGAGADVGKAEFAAALRAGQGRAAARQALIGARREARATGSFVELFMGPTQGKTKANSIKRYAQEFGTYKMAAQPYMRPAWDQDKDAALERLSDTLRAEIDKSLERARRKAAQVAAKG